MSRYTMTVRWAQENARFVDGRYSRAHVWEFDGGTVVPASSSPHVVPIPQSDPTAVDPEEAFVAALASCHMLWFLSIAAKQGFCVRAYRDQAEGTMAAGRDGRLRMTTVTLRPHVTFTPAKLPTADVVREMHEAAHHECFLASSVNTELTTVPTFEVLP
ncbi:MAG TPA: OsmC family protein [Gemmatimonadales bacterium]|jgi:organic hydroperoxide reductase OsmC/OhrA|nr:OsmC family protein [Gemmatimonadales bacterium]